MANAQPEPASNYVAPRDEPLKYPGNRPERSFVLAINIVHPILFDAKEKGTKGSTYAGRVVLDADGNAQKISDYLKSLGVAPLEERFAVLGYGSNPVPGQLASKFGEDAIVPVIFGGMKDSDVVYNLISNQGYAFAEMAMKQTGVNGNVGVTFLDRGQLAKMIASEQNYNLAFAPANIHLESSEDLRGGENAPAYMFAGFRKIWVPEGYDTAVAIAEIPSEGRTAKALNQEQTLDLVIEQFGLRKLGITAAQEVADRVRREMDMEEKPGKLKYDLQSEVNEDPRSLQALAEQVVVVPNSDPTLVFGNN